MWNGLRAVFVASGLVALVGASVFGQAAITQTTQDDKPVVVMENEFLRMVISPNDGGRCVDLVYKPTDTRFVQRRVGSLIGNRVWNYADKDLYFQWQGNPWSCEVQRRPGEVAVVLRAKGGVDFTRATEFEKRVSLRDGESQALVNTTFHVGQELMAPRTIGLWFFNQLGLPGQRTDYYFPLDDGIAQLDSGQGQGQSWFYNPGRGWIGLCGESGTGLSFNMEFRRLMCFYFCQSQQPTFEWAFRTMDIANGESFSTESAILVFHGLKAVHGSGGGMAAEMATPASATPAEAQKGLAGRARIVSGKAQQADLTIALKPMPEGDETPVHAAKVSLQPGKPHEESFQVKAPREGTWLVVGRLTRAGQELMDFVRPLQVGEAKSPVRVAAREERMGNPAERFEDRKPLATGDVKDLDYSTEIETQHVKWAKPYAGGRLKVLVITSPLTGREAAELAQRVDMDIIWVTAAAPGEVGNIHYLFNTPKKRDIEYLPQHMNEGIKRALLGQVDVVVLGGVRGSIFSKEVLELLKKKVSEGTGLVCVAPNNGADEYYGLLPVEKEKHLRNRDGEWRAAKPHFLTNGVPFDVLPRTDYPLYAAKGEVVATVGGKPLIVTQDGPGKGRVVVFAYNTGWQGAGNYSSGITPWVEKGNVGYKYWEYWFAALAKAVVWSARREAGVQIAAVAAKFDQAKPRVVVGLENGGPATEVVVEHVLSDAWGRVEDAGRRKASLAAGRQEVEIALPDRLPGGLHLADVFVKTGDGKALAWGATPVRLESPVRIEQVTFDKKAYGPQETARAEARLAADKQTAVTLRAEFTDALGRVVARAERAAEAPGAATFDLPVGAPLAVSARLRVTALAGDAPLAVSEAETVTFPERFKRRGYEDWAHGVWGTTGGAYSREYLVPAYAARYRDFGVSVMIASSSWQYDREFEWPVRQGFQIMPMSVAFGYINVGHRVPKGKMDFNEQRTMYQRTRDKQYLVRPVCLNDPKDMDPLAEKLRQLAAYTGWLEPVGYNLGDEMSITHYVTAFDYDFGEPALKEFREWLKKRYPGLDDLNRAWDTKFAAWDQVMPMTTEEVRERGNYAPWAEHREFMDETFAGFFEWTRGRLREKDAGATVGMSGSQAAEAHGGYQWFRLAHSLDFLQNYTHHNTDLMQLSFAPDMPRMPWYGYGGFNPGQRFYLWRRLFTGSYGASYFAAGSLFRPDLRFSETAGQALPVVREFQGGLARLLKACRRQAQVGVHYSHASIRGACVTGGATLFRENRMGWIQALDEAGLSSDFLATEQIEAGELAKRGYAAFLLPYSVCLSDKEAAALKAFVESGGLLLADARIGLMDERCRTRKSAVLEDVFGVSRPAANPLVAAREGEAQFQQDLGECRLQGITFDVSVAEPDLKAAGGQALGSHGAAPLFVVKKSGKGAAVLLNCFMDSFNQRRKLRIEGPLRRVVSGALAVGGVRPPVAVQVQSTPAVLPLVTTYASGGALYVGAQFDPGDRDETWTADAAFGFPRAGYVYDMREGKALGRTDKAAKAMLNGDAAFFAVLPYRVEAVRVAAGQVRQGAMATCQAEVRVSEAAAGLHVLRVEVLGPDGVPRPHYGAVALADGGKATHAIPLALNDPKGRWTVRFTDVVSRASGEAVLEVQ